MRPSYAATAVLLAVTMAGGASAQQRTAPTVEQVYRVGQGVYVRSLALEPSADALWVGTSVGALRVGLNSGEVEKTFTRDDGLANEYIFAIGTDSHGNKWFGTNGGGASRYQQGQWEVYMPINGLADYWVYAFDEQSDGDVWIGTWAGANRYHPDTGEMDTYVKELVNEWVYAIDVDDQDRVWFGTEGGVSMYDGEQWREWTHEADGLGAGNEDDLPASPNTGLGTRQRHDLGVTVQGQSTYNPGYVFSLEILDNGDVLAGTWGGGVARFDGEQWTNITRQDGLAGNLVYSIAREADGTLWFGTDRGLSRWDGESWRNYGTADGLPAQHIYAVTITDDGEIWAGTLGAVVRLGYSEGNDEQS